MKEILEQIIKPGLEMSAKYAKRKDKWGKGMKSDTYSKDLGITIPSYAVGMIEALVSEACFYNYFTSRYSNPITPPNLEVNRGVPGEDFVISPAKTNTGNIFPVDKDTIVDVKTGALLVNSQKVNADIYVFANYGLNAPGCDFFGYMTKEDVLKCEQVIGKWNGINYSIPVYKLKQF